jgi:hypothetical protein
MQRQGTSEDFSSGEVMRLTGIMTTVLSVAVGLVAMFAFPTLYLSIEHVLKFFAMNSA